MYIIVLNGAGKRVARIRLNPTHFNNYRRFTKSNMKAKEEIVSLLVAEVKKMIEKNFDGHFTYWLAIGSKMNYGGQ